MGGRRLHPHVAALLLTAGALSDRIGARRASAAGLSLFVVASAACGLAPTLVAARFVQGAAAAVLMPSTVALIRQAHQDPTRRARAVAVWAMGGAVASSGFLAAQANGAHPMVPLELFRSGNLSVAVAVGFAFIDGRYGIPLVMSLYLQQLRDLSPRGSREPEPAPA